jgi:GTP cyclohydrolase I
VESEVNAVTQHEALELEREALRGVRALIRLCGDNPEREGLQATPARVVAAMLEMTRGMRDDDPSRVILGATFERDGYDEMVVKRHIPFTSLCEHHLMPFTGHATVGYIPSARVVGLSKLSRLLDGYAARPQIQERLTVQVVEALVRHLEPVGAGVVLVATHNCVSCRGVRKDGAEMVTSALRGALMEKPEARAEFMRLAGV